MLFNSPRRSRPQRIFSILMEIKDFNSKFEMPVSFLTSKIGSGVLRVLNTNRYLRWGCDDIDRTTFDWFWLCLLALFARYTFAIIKNWFVRWTSATRLSYCNLWLEVKLLLTLQTGRPSDSCIVSSWHWSVSHVSRHKHCSVFMPFDSHSNNQS